MAREIITGLRIAGTTLEWTSIEKIKEQIKTVDSGKVEAETPPVSEGQEPISAESIVSDLVSKNASKLSGSIILGLPSDQLLMRVVKLPAVPEEELAGMVQLQVDKFSPFPVENMVVSYEIVEKSKDNYLVLVVAVKNEIVDGIGKVLANADIFPARVDADVLGWWQLLKDEGHVADSGRQIIILMAGNVPELIVVQDHIPIVFRSLSEQGMLTDEEFAAEIAGETAATLMSLELEHGGTGHCVISVWHKGESPVILDEALRQACPYETSFNSLDRLPPVSMGFARRTISGCTVLDLTPELWRVAEGGKMFRHRMLIAAGAVSGLWALMIIGFIGGLFYQQKKLNNMETQLALTEEPAREVMEMRRRVSIIQRYSDRTHSALECLREVTSLQPEGVELSSFEYKRISGPPTVTISGQAESVAQVYDFKNGLDASKLFAKGNMKGPFLLKDRQSFQIDMRLPIGGEE